MNQTARRKIAIRGSRRRVTLKRCSEFRSWFEKPVRANRLKHFMVGVRTQPLEWLVDFNLLDVNRSVVLAFRLTSRTSSLKTTAKLNLVNLRLNTHELLWFSTKIICRHVCMCSMFIFRRDAKKNAVATVLCSDVNKENRPKQLFCLSANSDNSAATCYAVCCAKFFRKNARQIAS